jgi:DNA-binding NtrC family response regulator
MLNSTQDCSTKLLIVDDDAAVRIVMSRVLIEMGYRVRTVSDGVSALAEIQREMPDIILSDLDLPARSGFALLCAIHLRYPTIKVIAMSRAFCGEEAHSGIGADAFYQKGCGAGSLLKIIRALPQPDRLSPSYGRESAPIWS